MSEAEFSRPLKLDVLGDQPVRRAIEADAAERTALTARFDLVALDRLEAALTVARNAGGIEVTGQVDADVQQSCVVSGVPVVTTVSEAVRLRFVRDVPADAEEVELAGQDLDTLPLEGESIDLGVIAADTMALALPLFPRASDAELAEARKSLLSEEEEAARAAAANNPFAALKKPH